MVDPFTKAKRQHLKRKILQYRWLREMGFNVSEDEERLMQSIKDSEFSLSELGVEETEGELVDWRSHRGAKMIRPIIMSRSRLFGVVENDSFREEP